MYRCLKMKEETFSLRWILSVKTFERIAGIPADCAIVFEARLMDRTGSESFIESVYPRNSPALIGFLKYAQKPNGFHACKTKWSLIMRVPKSQERSHLYVTFTSPFLQYRLQRWQPVWRRRPNPSALFPLQNEHCGCVQEYSL